MLLRQKRVLVYLYIDDSGRDGNIQVIGSIIIPSEVFRLVEQQSGFIIQSILNKYPAVLADPRFEFHATNMWNHTGPWDAVAHSDIEEIFNLSVNSLKYINQPCVTYGCVDISTYPNSKEGKHAGIDAAFEKCCYAISSWFSRFACNKFGTMLFDDPGDGDLKKRLRSTFRKLRPKAVTSPRSDCVLDCIYDDLYFGDSVGSVGLQVADICSWLIMRQLSGSARRDTMFYQEVAPFIFIKDAQ
jgi:hypothetical protein